MLRWILVVLAIVVMVAVGAGVGFGNVANADTYATNWYNWFKDYWGSDWEAYLAIYYTNNTTSSIYIQRMSTHVSVWGSGDSISCSLNVLGGQDYQGSRNYWFDPALNQYDYGIADNYYNVTVQKSASTGDRTARGDCSLGWPGAGWEVWMWSGSTDFEASAYAPY